MELSKEIRMKREQALLTPEESRLYEQFSIAQVQAMAQYKPIASTDGKKDD